MNVLKTIKNHPKKSIFGAVVLGYVGKWLNNVHENHLYRHAVCQGIKHKSLEPMHFLAKPKKVKVFYNPAASDGKAGKLYVKNSKPVLHLSGCNVEVVKLDYEGHAKQLMSVLDETTDMIVCAGGDGTVNEVITGLMRRPDSYKFASIPIGVIPLGRTNTICNLLCEEPKDQTQAQWITQVSANLFAGHTAMVDVFKVSSEDGKDAYGLSDFRWGSYRDAQAKTQKYWYWGSLKRYMTYIFRSMHSDARVANQLDLCYDDPLTIEENTYQQATLGPIKAQPTNISLEKIVKSVLPSFFKSENVKDEKSVEVVETVEEKVVETFDHGNQEIETIEFMASANTHHLKQQRTSAAMKLTSESGEFSFSEFITEGPDSVVHGRHQPIKPVMVEESKKFKIVPKNKEDSFYSIDNEEYEAFPCTVELLPNRLKMVYLPSS